MMNVNFVRLLAVAIHATVALLHSVRVPGNLNMDKPGAVVLQIHAFRCSIRCQAGFVL